VGYGTPVVIADLGMSIGIGFMDGARPICGPFRPSDWYPPH
jgi:hypothetical protein